MENQPWKKMWIRKHPCITVYIIVALAVVSLNVIAWNSTAFCDTYIAYVFPVWVNTYGRITSLFPFSVGEIMLGLAAVLAAFAIMLGLILLIIWVKELIGGKESLTQRTRRLLHLAGRFYIFFAWVFLTVCLVMTLNCFILYHGSTFSENYFGQERGGYTVDELRAIRNLVVEECNRLSELVERDGDGNVIYSEDMENVSIQVMQQLGKTYDRLDGYYPRPKKLAASDFFCQQYMQGYYFPFTMEANYNDVMYIMNKPSTMCHELAHLRGYIFEDEANFISYLACISSEDVVFQYSGYLSVLGYLDNDFYRTIGKEEYFKEPGILHQVIKDDVFVVEEEWERIESKALIDTEIVESVSNVIVDTTLKVNGVNDGKISYSRVVELLLWYYYK